MPNTPIQDLTLKQIKDALGKLAALKQAATDPDTYAAACEADARLLKQQSDVQNLQLAGDTEAMQAQAVQIGTTKAAFDAAAKNLAKADEVLAYASKFLDAVDALIKAAPRIV